MITLGLRCLRFRTGIPATFVLLSCVVAFSAAAQEQVSNSRPAYMKQRSGSLDATHIAWGEAHWNFLLMVASLEVQQSGEGQRILQAGVGLDELTARSVAAESGALVKQEESFKKELLGDRCREFQTSQPSETVFLSWLAKLEASEREEREQRLRKFYAQLEPAAQKKMEDWVAVHVRSKLEAIDVDYGQMLKDTGTAHTSMRAASACDALRVVRHHSDIHPDVSRPAGQRDRSRFHVCPRHCGQRALQHCWRKREVRHPLSYSQRALWLCAGHVK